MCTSLCYRALPYILALVLLFDLALGIIRIYIFFSPKSATEPSSLWQIARYSFRDEIQSPLMTSAQSQAGFALDWISSIVPTLMGVYLVIFGIVTLLSCFAFCDCIVRRVKEEEPLVKDCNSCCAVMAFMSFNKANHRFISLSCNCPCYRARPHYRFIIRAITVGTFLALRTTAVILYGTDKNAGTYGRQMASFCGVSLTSLLLIMCIDYYQYRMWWNYRPTGVYGPDQLFCSRPDFHSSHRGFYPMPLLGKNRDPNKFGDRPCPHATSGECTDHSLLHISLFHAFNYLPLKRYDPQRDKTYIGFHRTKNEFAVTIAKNGFKISDKPPQMLGFGVYFARSFADTEGKARQKGAYIVAEIEMGRVLVLQVDQLQQVSNSNSWWKQYDTVYYQHASENRDEFCVKSPKQIKKWIILMDDERIQKYGLDREFSNTFCGCI